MAGRYRPGPYVMNDLAVVDLLPFEREPRILDLLVAEQLGFSQPRDVRKLIKRHHEELERYGALAITDDDAAARAILTRHGAAIRPSESPPTVGR
jgi:hypothetical protein